MPQWEKGGETLTVAGVGLWCKLAVEILSRPDGRDEGKQPREVRASVPSPQLTFTGGQSVGWGLLTQFKMKYV